MSFFNFRKKPINSDEHYLFAIRDYLISHNVPYNPDDFTALNERKQGKVFTLSEHLKALVYSLMSAQTKWSHIVPHLKEVDRLFKNYDPEYMKSMPGEYFAEKIIALRCGSRCTKAQMKALAENVAMLQKLDRKYHGIDNYVTSAPAIKIAADLSAPSSPHKLKQVGEALAWEYLRNVGIDGAKPDTHMKRFLGADRMGTGFHTPATNEEVWSQVNKLSVETGMSIYEIDALIWEFCAAGYGEVCTSNPRCSICPVKQMCRRGKQI